VIVPKYITASNLCMHKELLLWDMKGKERSPKTGMKLHTLKLVIWLFLFCSVHQNNLLTLLGIFIASFKN
jgi:hypothetical protein